MWSGGGMNFSAGFLQGESDAWDIHGSNSTADPHLDSRSLYTHNPPPYSILFVFVTILVGVFMRLLQPKLPIPYTVVIMIFGIIYGILAVTVYRPLANYTAITRIDPHWILQIFLPILIFESSFTINFQMFRKAVGQILILATGGLALATCLTAVVVKYAFNYGWNWCASLMFGALISATDPVAVVALLKDVGASPELGVVLEGESLLNDGTAIIFFNIFLALNTIPDEEFSAESLAVQSVLTVAGGPLFGFVCGWIASWFIGRISNDAIAEVSVTLAAAYLTFYVSEAILNVSGVLAVVVLGLVLNYERTAISPEVEPWMHEFWSTLTYIANTLIFAIVGLTISEHALMNFSHTDWLNLLLLYGAIIVIRLVSIIVFLPVIRYAESAKQSSTCKQWRNVLVMGWGGLRGAVSLCLAMTVSRDPRLEQITIGDKVLIHTAGIVMLTLFVNGTTTAKLLSLLGMSRIPEVTIKAVDNALRHIFRSREREISVLRADHFLDEINWEDITLETNLKNPYRKSKQPSILGLNSSTETLATISRDFALLEVGGEPVHDPESYQTIRLVWLKLLRHSFWEQFERGLICRQTLVYLCGCVDKALSQSDDLLDPDIITARFSIGQRLTYCQKMLNKLTGHDTGPCVSQSPGTPSRKGHGVVESCWFTALVYLSITVHVTASIVNLALNWHGHHLDENFFHENVYFVAANAFFCLVYGIEIALSISRFGFVKYFRRHWNKLEIIVFAILLVDLTLDIYVLGYGDGGSHIHQAMLRFFDVLSLLRILRAIRLVKLVFPMMGKFMESLVTHRLMSGFDIGQAFMTGQEAATRWTESFIQNSAVLTRLKIAADVAHDKVLKELGTLLEERPDIARAVKKRYASRKIIQFMRKDLQALKTRGLIEEKAAAILQNKLHRKMEIASRIPYRTINPEDLLRRIPWIQKNRRLRTFLMSRAIFYKYPKQHVLIAAGDEPLGIFVILFGVVKPVPLPNVVASHQELAEKTSFASGETVGELLVVAGKRSPTSYVCCTATQVLCLPAALMQEAFQKFECLEQEIWDVCGRKMTAVLLASQPTFHHLSADKIAKRVNKGAVILLKDDNFSLLPEWELVILLHGKCNGLPQEIAMKGPKIISNQIKTLQFQRSHPPGLIKGHGIDQPVLFVLDHDRTLSRTLSTESQELSGSIGYNNAGFHG
ncbi:Sodium/hydrogen exchanger 7 [Hypsibius exemplaris]|uniref:Sodium/hydrogen exchanger 7 n=1 Tax=Hypsibius exemplaris TaxID=2072580 RepID=A0A9X6NCS4_HYPEX|nr:Sodium/hydrogen exchanger 7 [Hypsibius exemplaris]